MNFTSFIDALRLGELMMDHELPWAIRILRWGLCLFAVAYCALLFVEKAVEVYRWICC